MLINKPSDIKPSEITSKSNYLSRRKFLKNSINTGIAGSGLILAGNPHAASLNDIRKSPYSTIEEDLTDFEDITTYNNFYEFGTAKEDPVKNSGRFNPKPWSITVDGECNKPGEIGLEDILKPHPLEERIYRLRCVEAWSMVIPWVGIPLGDVLKRFEPTSNAKYVAFTTVFRPDEMPGQRSRVLSWPYREGLRIDEAMNPLTILAVGIY
ncbi:MAG: protein-methionine-sulfoxide reductase catalytic subunit MsrP, partial [Gammaproteobacteria bacterium]|nr:protein-methionine-sulfoxide reductase catalytic subunit MsrP [Gammaproteobacteria bacterium]